MRALAVAIVALLGAGCSSTVPLPITATDVCYNCRRPIADPSLAGEIITATNQALKFKTIACMVRWMKANAEAAEGARAVYVTDYTTGRIIRATSATFAPYTIVERYTKTEDFVAYYAPENAAAFAKERNTTPLEWEQVVAQVQ